jgi:transcription elongation factor GreA
MKDKTVQLTQEGLEKLKTELNERLTTIRTQIADRIEYARRMGDLSENAEYKAALEDRTLNEKVINDLQNMISNAEVIEKSSNGEVSLGSKVTVSFGGREIVYEVVGAMEADPLGGRISNESPIGSALIGKRKGTDVKVTLPTGEANFRIVDVK